MREMVKISMNEQKQGLVGNAHIIIRLEKKIITYHFFIIIFHYNISLQHL